MTVLLSLRYDLRAPSFGPPADALYRAALEQCAWAEDHGFAMVTLSEHHGADDGYCPSPLVFAAAVAGRTRSLRILVAALVLPLYDPIRLAEDLAVLDLASGGRVDLVIGAGYRTEELAMFGRQMGERVALVEEGIAVLRAAWSGEEFEYRGRRVKVTPRPARPQGPALLMGGATPAAARRPRGWATASSRSIRPSGHHTRPPAASWAGRRVRLLRPGGRGSSTSPTTPTRPGPASPPTPCTRRTPTAAGSPAPRLSGPMRPATTPTPYVRAARTWS